MLVVWDHRSIIAGVAESQNSAGGRYFTLIVPEPTTGLFNSEQEKNLKHKLIIANNSNAIRCWNSLFYVIIYFM